jgi:enhancing lycopene biosynthesis protein 2
VAQGDPSKLEVDGDLVATMLAFHLAEKPIGLCCISPVIAASVLKCEVTVGSSVESEQWPYV